MIAYEYEQLAALHYFCVLYALSSILWELSMKEDSYLHFDEIFMMYYDFIITFLHWLTIFMYIQATSMNFTINVSQLSFFVFEKFYSNTRLNANTYLVYKICTKCQVDLVGLYKNWFTVLHEQDVLKALQLLGSRFFMPYTLWSCLISTISPHHFREAGK